MTISKSIRQGISALIGVAAVISAFATGTPAHAEDVSVNFDQVILMRLAEPAADIIIGNPSIADVTPRSRQLLAITGKAFGSTNMIILGKNNEVLVEHQVTVRNGNDNYVAVTRGGMRNSYNCDTFCESTLTIGDDSASFSRIKTQMKDKAASASDPNSNNAR